MADDMASSFRSDRSCADGSGEPSYDDRLRRPPEGFAPATAGLAQQGGFSRVSRLLRQFELSLPRQVNGFGEDAGALLRCVKAQRVFGEHEVQPPLRLAMQRARRVEGSLRCLLF